MRNKQTKARNALKASLVITTNSSVVYMRCEVINHLTFNPNFVILISLDYSNNMYGILLLFLLHAAKGCTVTSSAESVAVPLMQHPL